MPLAPAMHFVPYWCVRSPAINPSLGWTLQGWGISDIWKSHLKGRNSGHVHPTHTKRARLARFSFQTSKLEFLFCARGEEYQLNINRCWTLNCYVGLHEGKVCLEQLQKPRQGSKLRCFCLSGSGELIDFALRITCASNTSQHPFVNSLAPFFSTTSKSQTHVNIKTYDVGKNKAPQWIWTLLSRVPCQSTWKTVTMGFHPRDPGMTVTRSEKSSGAEPRSLIQGHSIIASSHGSYCPNGFGSVKV